MTVDVETAPRILLSPPDVGELEQEYVMRAMRSGWVA
jgi:dTDP-4-amino-4,6-dideoxygalactose transaminase